MSRYEVTVIIQETLEKVIKANVECRDSDDAKERAYNEVRGKYKECEIVLCDTDFTGVDIIIEHVEKTK
ncbi:protein dpnD [Erysipelothrix sp. HDW6B]|uniref:DpnD/PcfM family protein n=1 Tax=Erysipelothrix sp. HDW6B TaxID=2714929 RepID=UPI00140DFBE7|nr:DpnD/PcfM family protein [Erysipelothrix sp. HDW6B]QIK86353.1 protein dpnD [Erysipelothrix sp. HDW6B]